MIRIQPGDARRFVVVGLALEKLKWRKGPSVLLGILSDSHGRAEMVRRAVELFDGLGAEMIIHCGDVGDVGVFDELAGRNCRFVWGNMDQPSRAIRAFLKTVGLPAPTSIPVRLDADGKRVLVFHGHEREFEETIRELEEEEDRRLAGARADSSSARTDSSEQRVSADYLLHGHTHQCRDERLGGTRIINPGALYRAKRKTVATLDTQTDELRFHEL